MTVHSVRKPVFVVGHPRSGTTLLATVLGRNSQLAMPPETQFLIEQRGFAGRVLDAGDMGRILQNARLRDLGLETDAVRAAFAKTDRSYGAAFATIIDCYRAKAGCARAGEKSPLHLRHTEQLLTWFPDASVICIERNGVDVIASLMRMPWSHRNIRAHGFEWNTSVAQAQALQERFPERFMIVRYEAFSADAEGEARRICAFSGLPFESAMLSAEESEAGTVPDWEKGWKADVVQPIAARPSRGQETLSLRQRNYLSAICNATLRKTGYAPVPSTSLRRAAAWLTAWPYQPKVRSVLQRVRTPFNSKRNG